MDKLKETSMSSRKWIAAGTLAFVGLGLGCAGYIQATRGSGKDVKNDNGQQLMLGLQDYRANSALDGNAAPSGSNDAVATGQASASVQTQVVSGQNTPVVAAHGGSIKTRESRVHEVAGTADEKIAKSDDVSNEQRNDVGGITDGAAPNIRLASAEGSSFNGGSGHGRSASRLSGGGGSIGGSASYAGVGAAQSSTDLSANDRSMVNVSDPSGANAHKDGGFKVQGSSSASSTADNESRARDWKADYERQRPHDGPGPSQGNGSQGGGSQGGSSHGDGPQGGGPQTGGPQNDGPKNDGPKGNDGHGGSGPKPDDGNDGGTHQGGSNGGGGNDGGGRGPDGPPGPGGPHDPQGPGGPGAPNGPGTPEGPGGIENPFPTDPMGPSNPQNVDPVSVPEPATIGLMGLGLAALGLRRRRN